MSSKSVDQKPSFHLPWSISTKLTALYALSAFGMLVLSSTFLYWVLANDLRKADILFLNDRLRVLRSILKERTDYIAELEEDVKWERPASGFLKYYARILDEKGGTLIETPGINIPPSLFPAPLDANQIWEKGDTYRLSGKFYILLSAWAQVGESSKRRLIQLALDVSRQEAVLGSYWNRLVVILVFGVFLSSAAGVAITRKGMRPLKEIADSAQKITADRLNARIATKHWPKELAALASALDVMLGRLEKSFFQLSQFSADLAHELRTPINNLMGEAGVALAKVRTVEEYKQALESSLEEYGRLSKIIDSLLFLARAENTEIPLERSLFDPAKEIEAIRDYYEALASESGIEIACRGHALLNADPILFRRVMTNLISNALQYTPKSGKITVEIVELEDQSVSVSVQDTGKGIDPKDLPNIFNRFYRAGRSRSDNPDGTGLGLAIVKSIVDLHGGSVKAKSELGKGTSITLNFPLRQF